MLPSWRWFGPEDPMPLDQIGQTGAQMLETSLSDIPTGAVWSPGEIEARKTLVTAHVDARGRPLEWNALGGIRIHDDIKLGRGDRDAYVAAFKQTIRNLARQGVRRILINVMPLIDWVRTDLEQRLPTGAHTTAFDLLDVVVFDICILKRPGAEDGYEPELVDAAWRRFGEMPEANRNALEHILTGGLPGGDSLQSRAEFDELLVAYHALGTEGYRRNMISFLGEICDVLEEEDALLAIHPDDPPWPICGLPKIASSLADYQTLFEAVPSKANGILLCTGALGASARNDLVDIAGKLASRVNYAHLRSVEHTARHGASGWSFREAEHLEGDIDLFAVARILVEEEHRRAAAGESALRCSIPYRADHGQRILDDLTKNHVNPGYTPIGMVKATAELRGMLHAIERSRRI